MSKIIEFDSTNASHIDRLTEFYVGYYREYNPEDPPMPREKLQNILSTPQAGKYIKRWFLQSDEIMASGLYSRPEKNNAEYATSGHIGQLSIIVLPKFRGNGYSKLLLKEIIRYAKLDGIQKFQYFASNDNALRWSEKLGAKKGPVGGENRLKLDHVDQSLTKRWIKEGEEKNQDVKLHHFISEIPENYLERFCDLYTETVNEAPDEGVEYTTVLTGDDRRKDEQYWKDNNQIMHVMVTEESNSELSGLTEVMKDQSNPFIIHQELTGVRSKFRGKGLGKWLKAKMIDYVLEAYPDAKIISTGNADSNKPMMSINERLGFYPYHRNTICEIDLEKIPL